MFSLSQLIASLGESPQFVGHVDTTSMMEYPLLLIWFSKPFLMAFFASLT